MIIIIFIFLLIALLIALTQFTEFSPVPLPIIPVLLFILFLFMYAFVHKIRKQCKKYGTKNVFRMSYHGKQIDMNDYVYMMLDQNTSDHVIQKWEDKILILNESGIYLFTCLHGKGTITGKLEDERFLCRSGKNEKRIMNPLIDLSKQREQLEKILGCPITAYLVIENHSAFLVESKIEVVRLKDVYTTMIKPHEKRYTKEQIIAYRQLIEEWMSNNVNNSVIA